MVIRTKGISAVVVQRTPLPITCFSSLFLSLREHCHYWPSFKYAGERAALKTSVWHVKATAIQLQPSRFWYLALSPSPPNFSSSARANIFFPVTWKGKDVALINTPSLVLQGTGGLAGGKQDGSWCSWVQDHSHSHMAAVPTVGAGGHQAALRGCIFLPVEVMGFGCS